MNFHTIYSFVLYFLFNNTGCAAAGRGGQAPGRGVAQGSALRGVRAEHGPVCHPLEHLPQQAAGAGGQAARCLDRRGGVDDEVLFFEETVIYSAFVI